MTKYILWWTKAVINVFFQQLKVIINTCFAVENTTSYEEVGRPNIFCDELRPSLMYFFLWQKAIINNWFAIKNTISNDEVKRPNTFCDKL